MTVIPWNKLRDEMAGTLRRAERGVQFTVTVAGRPVAELGPLPGTLSLARPERLAAVLAASGPDSGLTDDLRRMREEDREAASDPRAA